MVVLAVIHINVVVFVSIAEEIFENEDTFECLDCFSAKESALWAVAVHSLCPLVVLLGAGNVVLVDVSTVISDLSPVAVAAEHLRKVGLMASLSSAPALV